MIEQALRQHLQPAAQRRRHLFLARRFSILWATCGLLGVGLWAAAWLWAWRSPLAIGALCAVAVLGSIWLMYRSRRLQPDYRALARSIEQRHPDLRALLLAAIEQEPEGPDGELGFLQTQVLAEAVTHATDHDWSQGISTGSLALADLAGIAALLFLLLVVSQALPPISFLPPSEMGRLRARGYDIRVTPGDTEIEEGSPVVILARFEGLLPPAVDLLYGPSGAELQRMSLPKSLNDPVFGGILQDVRSNLLYHIEYAGDRTRDYAISVYQSPELLQTDARIVYPPYTKLPEKVITDTRQVSVVEGSEVTLMFTLNKPVATARLAPRAGIALGLSISEQNPNVLVTSLVAEESERYELQLVDAQGRQNKLPPRFTIDVHKNLPPELTVTFPSRDVVASPLEELTLEAEGVDDYGLMNVGLTYTLVGAASQEIVLDEDDRSGKSVPIHYLLALEDLNAQPDQLLTYYFWADDIGPGGETRRTVSDMYFAELRPFEEIFRESQSSQDQQNENQEQNQNGQPEDRPGEQLARLQKQIISATWNITQQVARSGSVEPHKENLDVVRQSQADALEQAGAALAQSEDAAAARSLQAAAEHMETSLEHLTEASESAVAEELTPALSAEQLAYQELLKLREREHQVARRPNAGRNRNASSPQLDRQLQQLELTQEENRYEMQRLAQSGEQASQREDLQVLNRLRDLARRQNEMSDRLREAEASLRQAPDERKQQETLRQLKRLRDEQLEAMHDLDELQQRMEMSENRRRMAEAREQLNDSRSQIRQSAEALEQGMVSRAITSATRAQRQLEQMRDEFQRRTAGQFSEEMRSMRDDAEQLDQRQKRIAEELRREMEARQKTLAGSDASRKMVEQIDRQKEDLARLVEQMRNVSEQAEIPEPLLSRELYDTLRQANADDVDRALETTGELLRRNFLPQAQEIERRAGSGIEQIRRGIQEAARSVLGGETEALRLARSQLDELIRQVEEETARADSEHRQKQDDPNQPGGAAGNRQRADSQPGRPEAGQDENSAERLPDSQPRDDREQARRGESPRPNPSPGDRGRQGEKAQASATGRDDPQGRGGGPGVPEPRENGQRRGPLTGENFRQWSDNLRDVEEMLGERDLREEAARVRNRAQTVRAEFKRHGTEPQWDLVRSQISAPLAELRQRVSERLAQLQSDEAMVPIDRDPVPERFADLVRTYFENLGSAEPTQTPRDRR